MRNFLVFLAIIAPFLLYNCDDNTNNPKDDATVTDIDGNDYKTVKIGEQIWMAENLNVAHYRNGDLIPEVKDSKEWANLTTGAWCYYDNDLANGDIYGKLYNWYAVNDPRGLAPEGWHVPSDDEWKELEMCLGMSQLQADSIQYRGSDEGAQLAGRADLWEKGNLISCLNFDKSKFSALPGGYIHSSVDFRGKKTYSCFWSSSEYNERFAWYRSIYFTFVNVNRLYENKNKGSSVRCIKNK